MREQRGLRGSARNFFTQGAGDMLCCYKQLERPPGLPVLHGITASLPRYPRPVTAPCFFLGPVCVTQCRLLVLARSVWGCWWCFSVYPLGLCLLL